MPTVVGLRGRPMIRALYITFLFADMSSAWVVNPTRFSNQYFKLLLTRKWEPRKWDGPFQYEATVAGTSLMMLPTDVRNCLG